LFFIIIEKKGNGGWMCRGIVPGTGAQSGGWGDQCGRTRKKRKQSVKRENA